MVTTTHGLEIEVELDGNSYDGISVERVRLVMGRDWKTKSWIHSDWIACPTPISDLILSSMMDGLMDTMREAEAERVEARLDAEEQKADDRWSERGLDL